MQPPTATTTEAFIHRIFERNGKKFNIPAISPPIKPTMYVNRSTADIFDVIKLLVGVIYSFARSAKLNYY